MSKGTLEYMLQIPAVQLKVLLNAVYKVVHNGYTFLMGDHLVLETPVKNPLY